MTISNTSEDVKNRGYKKHFGEQLATSPLKAAGPLLLSSGISPPEALSYLNPGTNVQALLRRKKGGNTNVSQQENGCIKVIYSLNKI